MTSAPSRQGAAFRSASSSRRAVAVSRYNPPPRSSTILDGSHGTETEGDQIARSEPLRVLYVAFGYEYFIMAANSARTLLETGTRAEITLVTNLPLVDASLNGRSLFDDIRSHDLPDDENRSFKVSLPSLTDHEYNIFLDADTEVKRPLQGLLPQMQRFDLSLRTMPYPTTKQYEVLPGVNTNEFLVSEYNSGVIPFRKTQATTSFFELWKRLYYEMGINSDQPSLLRAAYSHHDASIGPLGATWNAKPTMEAELGLLKRRPREIAILHYRDGFTFPPAARNLASVHGSISLEWTHKPPRLQQQIIGFEERSRVYGYGTALTRTRGGRKLMSMAIGVKARLSGQQQVALRKNKARKGRSPDPVSRLDRG